MITNFQHILKNFLTENTHINPDQKISTFAGRKVEKVDLESEISLFIQSKGEYENMPDKQLIKRFTSLCDANNYIDLHSNDTEQYTEKLAKKLANSIQDSIKNKQETLKSEEKLVTLLSPIQFENLQKKILNAYNIVSSSEYKSLKDFFNSKDEPLAIQFSQPNKDKNFLSTLLALTYFSEECNGKTKKELTEHWGLNYSTR